MTKIKTARTAEGEKFYYLGHTQAVVDDNGNNIEDLLAEQEEKIELLNDNTGVSDYPEFSTSKTYKTGTIVRHEGALFKFTSDHEPGIWDLEEVKSWSINAESQEKLTELGSKVQKGIFNNEQLNNLVKEIYSESKIAYEDVSMVSIKVAVYVNEVYYNSIYFYGKSGEPLLFGFEKQYSTKEAAINDWNQGFLEFHSGNYALVFNVSDTVNIDNLPTNLNHDITIEFSPSIHSLILEKNTAERFAINDFSTNQIVNTYVYQIYAPNVDYSVVTNALLNCCAYINGKYYNGIILKDKNSTALVDISAVFDTFEDALSNWKSGKVETLNGVLLTKSEVSEPKQYYIADFRINRSIEIPIPQSLDKVNDRISNLNEKIVDVDFSVNKYDKKKGKNGYIQREGFIENPGYRVSSPIFVKGGVSYKQTAPTGVGDNIQYAVTDIEGNILSIALCTNGNDGFYYYTPAVNQYIVINIGWADNADVTMFSELEKFPNVYTPYMEILQSAYVYKENIIGETSPSLNGKVLAVNGDSICYGAGFLGGYAKIIAERNQMALQNIAVGGGTIAAETYYKDTGAKRHWICRTINNMREDADYVLLEGGVNDPGNNVPIGQISDGYTANLDDTTFYGAFESMLKQLIIRFGGKKIGYIAVHKMTDKFSSVKTNGEDNYYHAAKKCCEKWGVPFLDLNVDVPAFGMFPKDSSELGLIRSTYTSNSDGWHPSEEGYKKYYCDKIEEWMKTL